ncbi:16S rRNA (cytosine(1402)-N(4))-methyltransferase RsmH [Tyzzerella nexilis]|nr:16S rRNA (cytosine(1402)-N(4))-methyltransferase RsmH [[Clostridium] nexile]MCB7556804.1 16S rRNA (cytosine(1402)-N(4))-methyltransferase RsmH [[Clostridium] nexile]NSD85718.1 16S rRNA (cytosine(1402)-N(4))-methyltransferase RsmH [[Clostridium] nexile]NSD88161.1 16S rRNA (cytosine(1402)-N(4))-methyltransferase RsmH [[Clostridium] nexile]
MENQEKQHKRRVRYKGTHPRSYKEKYKELNPEKYPETVEKVIGKGGTPAGMHISICVKEILDFFQIEPGQKGLDATLGYGGHTLEMLKCLKGEGHLYALDIDQVVEEAGPFDFILADLGVSSMQIDNPDRGFTYKSEGPLDLRLNPEKGESAAERLKNVTEDELEGMLVENSDEPYAAEIAQQVMKKLRQGEMIDTTTKLYETIEEALSFIPEKERKEAVKKSCQRTFQALRIDVNSEFEVLYALMEKLPSALKSGGKVAILTFHSGEDRIVKKAFKEWKKAGVYSEIANDVIRPSAKECVRNSRAKSTKMRWAIKA